MTTYLHRQVPARVPTWDIKGRGALAVASARKSMRPPEVLHCAWKMTRVCA